MLTLSWMLLMRFLKYMLRLPLVRVIGQLTNCVYKVLKGNHAVYHSFAGHAKNK